VRVNGRTVRISPLVCVIFAGYRSARTACPLTQDR
jgi:hypothetical protein